MKRIGVAVIGAGMVGRAHAAGYRSAGTIEGAELPPIDLVAISDINSEFAESTARRYGYERAENNWKNLLNDDRVHVVSVAVANSLHREMAEALLKAGKHVLCEKPLAPTSADAGEMVKVAKAHKGQAAGTGFTYRRSPGIAGIKNELDSGSLGKGNFFNGHYWCDYSADPTRAMSWRYKGDLGTGVLQDLGSHIVDLGEFLFGPIDSISGAILETFTKKRATPLEAAVGHGVAKTSDVFEPVENEDFVSFTIKFKNGATGTISSSRSAHGHANGLGFDIHAEKGSASFDLARMGEFKFLDLNTTPTTEGYRTVYVGPTHPYIASGLPMNYPTVNFGQNDHFVWQARAFLEEVAGIDGFPRVATFEEGFRNMRILDAVVESSKKNGAEIKIN